MVSGVASVDELPSTNKVSFVTFNYDRSLEAFMMKAAMNTFGKDTATCARAINGIPIVHVYGKVGRLDWQKDEPDFSTRPYMIQSGVPDSWAEAKKFASGIKVMKEGSRDSPELEKARQLISQAKAVYFLGFGYHPENMQRLNPSIPGSIPKKDVRGTFRAQHSVPERIKSGKTNGFSLDIAIPMNVPISVFLDEIAQLV